MATQMAAAVTAAWSEWEQSGDAAAWEAAVGDGIVDAAG